MSLEMTGIGHMKWMIIRIRSIYTDRQNGKAKKRYDAFCRNSRNISLFAFPGYSVNMEIIL